MAEKRTTRRRLDDDELAGEYEDDLIAEDEDLPEDTGVPADGAGDPVDDARETRGTPRRPARRPRPRPASAGRRPGLTAAEVAQVGLQQIAELTGKRPEGATQVQPRDDNWTVGVEVIEDRRVPSSADILALYEIDFDQDGQVLSYRRVRRYARGRGDDEGA
jgi:hypothetical protein